MRSLGTVVKIRGIVLFTGFNFKKVYFLDLTLTLIKDI